MFFQACSTFPAAVAQGVVRTPSPVPQPSAAAYFGESASSSPPAILITGMLLSPGGDQGSHFMMQHEEEPQNDGNHGRDRRSDWRVHRQ
jgi:hypothetical protein